MTETTANSEYASKEMEIGQEAKDSPISDPENAAVKDTDEIDAMATPAFMIINKWQRLANKLELRSGAEARGIERVDEPLRMGKTTAKDYFNMSTIWFSVNLTVFPFHLCVCLGALTYSSRQTSSLLAFWDQLLWGLAALMPWCKLSCSRPDVETNVEQMLFLWHNHWVGSNMLHRNFRCDEWYPHSRWGEIHVSYPDFKI
jgi:hypothetical protein